MQSYPLISGLRITSDRCALLGNDTVIVSDLHIGYESVLEEEGIHIPRVQTREIEERLLRIIERHTPERLIFLGDFKHEFSRNLDQEWNDVRRLLSMATDLTDVLLVRGNHDNYLAAIASKLGIDLLDSYCQEGFMMAHGHIDNGGRPLLIGHEHPSIKIFDSVGAFVKLPCFIHAARREIVVLPAFSPLASGTDLSVVGRGEFLSPALRDVPIDEMEVFACSEIGLLQLGSLSAMRKK